MKGTSEGTPVQAPVRRASRKRWWALVLGLTLVLTGAGAARLLSERESRGQMVSALIQVAWSRPSVLEPAGRAEPDAESYAAYRRTQAALLRSRRVLTAALKRDEAAKLDIVHNQADPVAWLERNLQIEVVPDTELIRVGMRGRDPEALAKVVHAVVEAYLDEVVGVERMVKARRLTDLEKAYADQCDVVRTKKDRLRHLARSLGYDPNPVQEQLLLARLGELDRQLLRVRLERSAAEARGRKDESAVLQAQENLLNKDIESLLPAVVRGRWELSLDYEMLRDEIAQDEQILRRLNAKVEAEKLEAKAAPRVSVFQEADVTTP